MKTVRISLSILALLVFSGINVVMGQWSTNGIHIYNNNSGNVGIGINTPGYLLHVSKNMTSPSIRIQNAGGAGGAAFEMIDNLSGADWKFKATQTGGFKIRDHANGLDVIQVEPNSAANALYINNAGNIGLGTSTPNRKLMIEGPDFELHDNYPFIFLNNSDATGNAGISFRYENDYRAWIYFDDYYDVLRLNAEAGGGYRNDLVIKNDGRVCLGTTTAATGYTLSVNGKVACTEVLVEAAANWPDYVFREDYRLMSLSELEASIKENNHLPGIPSASEIEDQGFELGGMQQMVLRKVEELTLYVIEQGKQITDLQDKITTLEKENQELKSEMNHK
jgi:hypothetical protein